MVSSLCGPVEVAQRPASAGDVRHTSADTRVAATAFGYQPQTTLAEGVRAMVDSEGSCRAIVA